MQRFEVTVNDTGLIAQEMQVGIRYVSRGYEDEMMLTRTCSTDILPTTFVARMATAVMSRFCAYIFPRYDLTIHLGQPYEPYYTYGGEPTNYEMGIIIKGVMSKGEQTTLLEMLNRIVAESQREAMG